MYPLSMQLPAPVIGFALASDADEHQTLTAAGYLPAFEFPEVAPALAEITPALDAAPLPAVKRAYVRKAQ